MPKYKVSQIIVFMVLSTGSAHSQTDFEKYYNSRSDYFNNMSEDRQNGVEGLAVLLDIEATFDKLLAEPRKKFLKRMGDTYLMMSEIYAAQNDTESSLVYLQKSADAGFKDPKFIAKIKEFDKLRDDPAFVKIIAQMKNTNDGQQVDPEKFKISVKQLKKDLAVLKASLEEAHQGLYQYLTKKEVDALFSTAASAIQTEMTPIEFYNIVSQLTASIKDGHTRAVMPAVLSSLKCVLPVGFTMIDKKVFVFKIYDPSVNKYIGAELKSINNVSATEIIDFAMSHWSSDGDNITFKTHRFKNPVWFSEILTMISGRQERFNLILTGEEEKSEDNITIDGITRDSMNVLISKNEEGAPASLFFKDELSTAILTIRTFSAREMEANGINFPDFLQSGFADIADRKIKNLIIDVRGNGGGEDAFGRLSYSYFTEEEFLYYKSLTLAKNKFKLFDYMEGGQRDMPEDFGIKNQSGTFDVTKKYNSNVGIQHPLSPRFAGHVYVLIDGGCFSTTCEFLSKLRATTKAEYIGEETGGNSFVNNSGIIAEVILPNSRLTVKIPMLKYTMNVPQDDSDKGHGIRPNHPINETAHDIVKEIDVQIDYALKLIKDSR